MQIEMTVPIIVNDVIICEFDAAIDINVLSHGSPAQTYGPPESCDPGEGPEWEVEATYVELREKGEDGKYVSKLVECPDELLVFITRYIDGEVFMDRVCEEIGENDSYDYRNRDDYM